MVLQISVFLVLLIACANLMGLEFAGARERQEEIAVRLSLGVTRRRLIQQLFTEQLQLAANHRLPVIVHARRAMDDVISLLRLHGSGGVVHSFAGSLQQARQLVRHGHFDLRRALGLGRELRRRGIQVLHAFLLEASIYAALARVVASTPVLVTSTLSTASWPTGCVVARAPAWVASG